MRKFTTKEEYNKHQKARLEAFCDTFANYPDPVDEARRQGRPPNYLAVSKKQFDQLAAVKERLKDFLEYQLIWSPLLIGSEILFYWNDTPPTHAEIKDSITWRKLADRNGE